MDAEVILPPTITEKNLRSLAFHVLREEGASGSWQFGIRFIDDDTMQQAHIDFMGIDSPTDIMSFPYEDDGYDLVREGDETLDGRGGDLLISADRAADHARDAGWDTDQELFFVVIHGVLHILGWDDDTYANRDGMLERQMQLLIAWTA